MVLLGILTIVAPFKPVVLISRFFLWSYLNFGVVMIICGILCLGLAVREIEKKKKKKKETNKIKTKP